MKQYLVLDFGGTFTKYALMDETGAVLRRGKVASACGSMEQMLASVAPLREQFAGQYEGVAVSMPGRINTRTGIAHTGGYFTFVHDTPVQRKLEEVFGVPATIANDGKCAANAEAWSGALADVEDGVVIVLGTGTGGGIVLGHQVRLGCACGAGELSFLAADLLTLQDGIPSLDVNFRSVWADTMSANGLLKLYGVQKGHDGPLPGVDGLAFFAAYDSGEPEAAAALEAFGRYAAAGIYSMQAVLDVQRIAIGGGISARPEVTQVIRQSLDRQYEVMPFTAFGKPEVVTCRYGSDANLIGALAFHLERTGAALYPKD